MAIEQSIILSADLPTPYTSHMLDYMASSDSEAARATAMLKELEAEQPIQDYYKRMEHIGDLFTRDHSRNVSRGVLIVGMRLGFSALQLQRVGRSAAAHDWGKTDDQIQPYVRSKIRFTPGSVEREAHMAGIRPHVYLVREMVMNTSWDLPTKLAVAAITGSHHLKNKVDSYGTPSPPEFAAEAEVLAGVDMVDALASQRPYKQAYSRWLCRQVMTQQFSGSSEVVAACFGDNIDA